MNHRLLSGIGTKVLLVAWTLVVSTAVAQNAPRRPTGRLIPQVPDRGDVIAFCSDRDGDFEIYLINVDGSGLNRIQQDWCQVRSAEVIVDWVLEGGYGSNAQGACRGWELPCVQPKRCQAPLCCTFRRREWILRRRLRSSSGFTQRSLGTTSQPSSRYSAPRSNG